MSRRFDGGPALDQVVDWCRTAVRAPTAGFSQGCHLVILDGEALQGFWRVSGAGHWFSTTSPGVLDAPYVVLVGGCRSAYTDRYASPDKAGHGLEAEAGWSTPFWLTDAAMAQFDREVEHSLRSRADSDRPSGSPTRRPRVPDHELVHIGRW